MVVEEALFNCLTEAKYPIAFQESGVLGGKGKHCSVTVEIIEI